MSLDFESTIDDNSDARAPIIVCYGAGVDSTAMLIGLRDVGIIPDVITFADTGGEKPETYAYLDIMDAWLVKQGFPRISRVRHRTLENTSYDSLGGNCKANETLPSLAFGMKSCSIKWKQVPQDHFLMGCKSGPNKCDPHPVWLRAQAMGIKPIKLIGYDNGKADLRRSRRVMREDEYFQYRYPLQDWGWARSACVEIIAREGLPVPIKSACYFCPASQKWELWWLAGTHPELFMDALRIEHIAMLGKHSRWNESSCNYDQAWEDAIREPGKQWPTSTGTVGLGRRFSWNHWARAHGIVCPDSGQFIGNRKHCLEMAEVLRQDGGNAQDGRTGCAPDAPAGAVQDRIPVLALAS